MELLPRAEPRCEPLGVFTDDLIAVFGLRIDV